MRCAKLRRTRTAKLGKEQVFICNIPLVLLVHTCYCFCTRRLAFYFSSKEFRNVQSMHSLWVVWEVYTKLLVVLCTGILEIYQSDFMYRSLSMSFICLRLKECCVRSGVEQSAIKCANVWRSSIFYMTCIQVSTWSVQASFSFYCLKKYICFWVLRITILVFVWGILRSRVFPSSELKATSCNGIRTTWLQKQKRGTGGSEDQVTLLPHFYVLPCFAILLKKPFLCNRDLSTLLKLYSMYATNNMIARHPNGHMHTPLSHQVPYRVQGAEGGWQVEQNCSITRSNEAIVYDCLGHKQTCGKWWLHKSKHMLEDVSICQPNARNQRWRSSLINGENRLSVTHEPVVREPN